MKIKMKKILLVSNKVFHYREKVYNSFAKRFARDGYEFHVISNEFQKVGYPYTFIKHEVPFSVKTYCHAVKEMDPAAVIVFLHLKDRIYLPLINYCKRKKIPVIYWNKPYSSTDKENRWKNLLYHHIQNRCDALITYTPDMKRFFSEKNQRKLFVAFNTLSFEDIDKSRYCDPAGVKRKYGIKENKVILYVSRMQPYKRPELLVELFAGEEDIAVVLMGSGMTDELQKKIDMADNVYYLGEKYGDEGNEIFSIADVFSTPGNIGLSVNEALFWNIPIVLLKGEHAPEIYYMKDGETGFLAEDEESFKQRVIALLNNPKELTRMRKECQKEFEKEVSIDRMYQGFIDSIRYLEGGVIHNIKCIICVILTDIESYQPSFSRNWRKAA